jgi:hypothetical protein
MTSFSISVYLNEGPTRMWEYKPGDPLQWVTDHIVVAESKDEALEVLWRIGNKMGPDASGGDYPSNQRSMCMGDVALVTMLGTIPPGAEWSTFHTVEAMGWSAIDRPSPDALNHELRAHA